LKKYWRNEGVGRSVRQRGRDLCDMKEKRLPLLPAVENPNGAIK